ncbi:hypothetical protein [Patulibacter sp.]|uniref:hypothetical protein n=1 Tax=Patulibacter sp. TaxID=1912859 RepID=UPI0027182BAE|nr:hypothetical protein [Patulibacter sp.]MDO9407314.1 hypothetical protein [Patulibacter sp.]
MSTSPRPLAAGTLLAIGALAAVAPPAQAGTTVRASGGPTATATVCGAQRTAVTVARGEAVRLRLVRTGASRGSRRAVSVRIDTCRDGRFGGTVRRRIVTSRGLSTATPGDYRVRLNGRSAYVRVVGQGTAPAGPAGSNPPAATPAVRGVHAVRTTDGSLTLEGTLESGPIGFTVKARRTAQGVVSGQFRATGSLASIIGVGGLVPFDFQGPITCFDAKGDQATIYYPLQNSTPEPVAALFGGVLITVDGDPDGGLGHFSFAPVPVALAPAVGCGAGGPTPLIVSGGSLAVGTPQG